MTLTDSLLQLLDSCNQLFNSLLQTSDLVLTSLEGGLLKTQKTLQFNHPSLQILVLVGSTIDLILDLLPPPGEDPIVLQDSLLNLVGGNQDLLTALLGVCFNSPDLSAVSSPLLLSIIHLWEKGLVNDQNIHQSIPYPVFQLHNTGEGAKVHSS